MLVTDLEADRRYTVRRAGPPTVEAAGGSAGARDGAARLEAPMPGRVVVVATAEGDRVRERQTLVVLEAMKIEHTVVAPLDGVVRAVHCQEGQTVEGGALLVELDSGDG
ncbi:MAG: acetyl-CoA carboxylase biotin carboxyl carrier protein subunit [Chloroflexi bacterium]|nr:acetyl-CoA carboxylase biotin carboxyl carrier protein subunit [Chloroflexota bacterium]